MIIVLAEIEIASGKRESFLEEFQKLVPQVQAEDGCLEYGPAIDLETGIAAQQPVRNDVVVVVEKWESLSALKDHLATPHMNSYRESVKDLVKNLKLQILSPA